MAFARMEPSPSSLRMLATEFSGGNPAVGYPPTDRACSPEIWRARPPGTPLPLRTQRAVGQQNRPGKARAIGRRGTAELVACEDPAEDHRAALPVKRRARELHVGGTVATQSRP